MLASFELPLLCGYFPPSRLYTISHGSIASSSTRDALGWLRASTYMFYPNLSGYSRDTEKNAGGEDLDMDTFKCVI